MKIKNQLLTLGFLIFIKLSVVKLNENEGA